MDIRKFFRLPGSPGGERIFNGDPAQALSSREFPITGRSVELAMATAGVEMEKVRPNTVPQQTSAESLVERIVRDGYLRGLVQHGRRAA